LLRVNLAPFILFIVVVVFVCCTACYCCAVCLPGLRQQLQDIWTALGRTCFKLFSDTYLARSPRHALL
jgi:hypothetical protein